MAMGVVHKFTKGLVPTAQDSDLREYNDRCHGQAGGFNSLAKELQEVFPDHVVNKWLGHSGKVAEKHYLQVTDEHWGKAMESRPPAGSPIGNPRDPSVELMKQQNRAICRVLMVTGGVVMTPKIGPVGLEPTTYGLEIRCSVQLSYEPVNENTVFFAVSIVFCFALTPDLTPGSSGYTILRCQN